MIFEHFALNVADIDSIVSWYCAHLQLTIKSQQNEPPFMTFLADASGRVIIEFYQRPDVLAQDFTKAHPVTFHIAFVAQDAEAEKQRLLEAGARFVEDIIKTDGSHLVMLRDPWGIPLQLCQRAQKF